MWRRTNKASAPRGLRGVNQSIPLSDVEDVIEFGIAAKFCNLHGYSDRSKRVENQIIASLQIRHFHLVASPFSWYARAPHAGIVPDGPRGWLKQRETSIETIKGQSLHLLPSTSVEDWGQLCILELFEDWLRLPSSVPRPRASCRATVVMRP